MLLQIFRMDNGLRFRGYRDVAALSAMKLPDIRFQGKSILEYMEVISTENVQRWRARRNLKPPNELVTRVWDRL